VTSYLTVGRRPSKGYKKSMRLTDAYERLQWGAPLSFERAALGQGATPPFPRGIGTSVHMLTELYLDMVASRDSAFQRNYFLVECLSAAQAQALRTWLVKIHHALDLDVDLEHVRFAPSTGNREHLRGYTWYSWAVFCDHSVKEDGKFEADRNVGPYGLIRRLEPYQGPKGPCWKAYDRDGRYLGALTDDGKSDLMDTATCPITLGGPRPTTYPASPTIGRDLETPIRLRKAFSR